MKNTLLLFLALLMFSLMYSNPWDQNQPIVKKKYHKSMKSWASYFLPYNQRYQLDATSTCSSGYCVGSSFYFLRGAMAGNESPVDMIYTMSVQGATSGSSEMNEIISLQNQVNQIYQGSSQTIINQNWNSFFSGLGLTSTNYPGTIPSEINTIVTNYQPGQGINSPNIQNQLDVTIERVLNSMRQHFSTNPVGGLTMTNLIFEYGGSSELNRLDIGHMVTIFRTPSNNYIFFDSNVGFGLFENFTSLSGFLNEYYRRANRVDSSNRYRIEIPSNIRLHTNASGNYGPNYQLCVQASASRAKSSGITISTELEDRLDFCSKKLILKNLNYEDLNVNIWGYNWAGAYSIIEHDVSLKSAEQIKLSYRDDNYYYKDNKVAFIDLDSYGTAPNLDFTDNLNFATSKVAGAITYKPAVLWDESVIVGDYNSDQVVYNKTLDLDGIGKHSKNNRINGYVIGETQYIELSKWDMQKFDVSKLKKIKFENVSYDNMATRRVRLGNSAWDLWPDINQGTVLEFDYKGDGNVSHESSVVQQIDLYHTGPANYYSGDEFDFNWHNAKQINYRPFWLGSGDIPVFTLVDFENGYYSGYVDPDGVNSHSRQMYIGIDISLDGETLSIQLYGHGDRVKQNQNVNEVGEDLKLIYPNPVKESFSIKNIKELYDKKIKLIDLKGVIHTLGMDENNSVDISGLAKGMYVVELQTGENTRETYKIIKE